MYQSKIPVRLDNTNEPEPDVAVIRPREDDYRSGLPGPADVLLIIEVAASSIDYDRGVKLTLYARHGIPEFWIVNVDLCRVEIYRSPDASRGTYSSCSIIDGDRLLDVVNLPGVSLPAARLFGQDRLQMADF